MAITVLGAGDQTATVTTEHTLQDVAVAGAYALSVDLSNMVAGDVLELRIKKILKAGGTLRLAYFDRFCDLQPTDNNMALSYYVSNALTDSASLRFTLKQTFGTSRVFGWEVLKESG